MIREDNRFPAPPVPVSITNASQEELSNLEMEILEGDLPSDLQGYIFMVAPAGNNNEILPYEDGNTFLSGDGMIYRLDLTESGKVKLTTQIAKPPDYIADREIDNLPNPLLKELLKFRNHGVVRFSLLLGSRNLLNTAFLPVQFAEDSKERLLVTYDAGRPYEINSKTLSVLNPVGTREEWEKAIDLPFPFSPILSTAHPAFDTYTKEMFTVNYGRSLSNFLGKEDRVLLNKIDNRITEELVRTSQMLQVDANLEEKLKKLWIERAFVKILSIISDFVADDFVNIIGREDRGSIKRWKLVNPDGSPVKIEQSIHQIGVTQNYVILLDTSFAIGIEHIIGDLPIFADLPILGENYQDAEFDFKKELRKLFKSELKPSVDSIFYLIRREDLKDKEEPVVAHQIKIPVEASHFLVDYDDNQGKNITLHVAHIAAWHVAEWMRSDDISPTCINKPLRKDLRGMQQCEMDISRMGRYEIDFSQEEPKIIAQKIITDELCTWGPGLFAYLDRLPSTGKTPKKLDNIYWISFGLWDDLMTDYMYELYKDYEYRKVPLEDLCRRGKEGIPATLFRLNTSSNESMAIADYYEFPPSHIALSPQFVPRANGEESSTNGYIFCLVFNPEGDEIWVFDAGDLNQPVCKLRHPDLNFAFSLHSTWLSSISDRQLDSSYSVREDYQDSIEEWLEFLDENLSLPGLIEPLKQAIANLFEEDIYQKS